MHSSEVCTVPSGSLGGKKNLTTPGAWLFLLPIFPSCLPLSALLPAPGSLLSFACSACPTPLSARVPLGYAQLLPLEGPSPLFSRRFHATQRAAARARNPQPPSPTMNRSLWLETSILPQNKKQRYKTNREPNLPLLSGPFESVLKSRACIFNQQQRRLSCTLSSPSPSCPPVHLADATAFLMPSL